MHKYLDTIELTLKIPYLESSIILALVIVNPALIMISSNSPILRTPSGLIKASVLERKKKYCREIQPTQLSSELWCTSWVHIQTKTSTSEKFCHSHIFTIPVSHQFPCCSWMPMQHIILIRTSFAHYNFLGFVTQVSSQCSTSSYYLPTSPFALRTYNVTTSWANWYLDSSSLWVRTQLNC